MDDSVRGLKNHKLLQFNRDKPAFDILKYVTNAKLEEEGEKSVIKMWKGPKKYRIKITPRSIRTKGDEDSFKKELKIWEKDCLNEYAVSVRSKKELLKELMIGEFTRFVLVPVLLEVYNLFELDLEELTNLINNTRAEKSEFLFFKKKERVEASHSEDTLGVVFENAQFSMKFRKVEPDPSLLEKNFDLDKFQNDSRDAFYAGLIYTLKALDEEEFDYSIDGNEDSLQSMFGVILEALYKHLIIENV